MEGVMEAHEAIEKLLKDKEAFDKFLHEIVDMIDENRDKMLSFAEIENFMNRICLDFGICQPPSKERLQEIFEKIDADKNNLISHEELAVAMHRILERQEKELTETMKIASA
eukprot:TRINITY_DN7565_c0_g1_i1.p2 TRINITY_DN7565_c0_g1~~TRINITY_DN7565_c0_g1_i1.p2  ORF type:complete len:112 (-),score=52.95 TRINITY_DN7565_c0_g1_i1:142-477(-)